MTDEQVEGQTKFGFNVDMGQVGFVLLGLPLGALIQSNFLYGSNMLSNVLGGIALIAGFALVWLYKKKVA